MESLVNSVADPITTLSGAFTIGNGTISVNAPASPDVWPINQEFRVRIGTEIFIVSAATSNAASLTVVTAGAELTAPANHANGDKLYPVFTKASLERWVQKYGLPGDIAPAAANALDDEFSGSTIDAKWSWRNQGGASYAADFNKEVAKLTAPGGASSNVRIIEQAAPGTDFTVVAKLYPALPALDVYLAGIVLVNNTNGKLLTLEYRSGSTTRSLRLSRWTNVTTFSTTVTTLYGASAGIPLIAPVFFKFVTSASKATISPFFSGDGYSWIPLANESTATHLGSIDRVGIFLDAESATFNAEMTLYHFRVS